MPFQKKIIFILIFLISVLLRLWNLDKFPPSLNWDEISHAYNAYSLALTGKDQWGIKWPVFNFRAYGDYPTALNMYLTLPSVKIFGLNPWTTRLPSAIAGILLVPLTFFLTYKLFKNYSLALIAMFLTAVSPWTIFTSRAVFQSTVAQVLLLAGITLILYRRLTLGLIFWALSAYAYHNTRIIAFPLLISFLFIFKYQPKIKITSLIIFLIIIIPCLINLLSPESRARSQWVSLINPGAINLINQQRSQFHGSPVIARIIYNKATYFLPRFVKNYLDFFNPYLLFFKGSANFQFNIPNTGLIFAVFLPFFYLGLLSLFKNYQYKSSKFIFAWYFIGLLPAAITGGDFPIIRAMTILPLPQILIALGLTYISSRLQYIVIFLSLLELFQYFQLYTDFYPKNYSQSWQYGYRQTIDFIKLYYPIYSQIVFTKKYGEPHEYLLFYWPWNPRSYQNDPNLKWDYHAGWYWVDSFDKFKFVNDWEMTTQTKNLHNTLVVSSHLNYTPENAKLLQIITFLDGSPAFDIVAYE